MIIVSINVQKTGFCTNCDYVNINADFSTIIPKTVKN